MRLEFEDRLERALADLGLIRRVGGEELAALDQVVQARRRVVTIVARAEERRRLGAIEVLRRHLRQCSLHLDLARRIRQLELCRRQRALRQIAEQLIHAAYADGGEHVTAIGVTER